MANVVLTRAEEFSQEKINEAVSRALDTLSYGLNDKTDLIVVKPNLCYYWDYSTGETTDPRVVSALIDWIRRNVGNDARIVLAESDASAMRTKHAFRMLGFEKLSSEKDVRLVNLSEGEIIDKEVVVAGEKFSLPVNKMLLDADLVINVPKMKIHRAVGFTCALKNMFGTIAKPRKYVYHSKLARVIVGINKLVRTHIVLVDGVVALGKTPKKMGVILASDDVVAADSVMARAMSHEPSAIRYLKLAISEGIGNVDKINLIENPVRLEEIKNEFPKQNFLLQKLSWRVQLKLLKLYSRLSKDVIPPILDEAG